jgi:hypothetical protein
MVTPTPVGPGLKPVHWSLFWPYFSLSGKGVPILTLFPGFDNFWFYRSPNFVSMRWSQVFSYVFSSFASFYALDSSHSDGIVSAHNFQCVGCKINPFDLFFSKNPFCSPRAAIPFVLSPQREFSELSNALRTPKAAVGRPDARGSPTSPSSSFALCGELMPTANSCARHPARMGEDDRRR